MFKVKNIQAIKLFFTAILIFAFCRIAFSSLDFFRISNLKYRDIVSRISYYFKNPPQEIKDIVIVKIDDESIKEMNRMIPWPRSLFAELLAKISLYNPRVVVFDMLLVGQSPDAKEDLVFSDELQKSKNVLLGSYFDERGKYVLPYEVLRNKALGWGFVNHLRDSDSYIRAVKLVEFNKDGNIIDYSLSLKAAALYYGCALSGIKFNKKEIILSPSSGNQIIIPTSNDGSITINFCATVDRFNSISFSKVLSGDFAEDLLKDKLVIIGATSQLFHDVYFTSFGLMPGVALVSNDVLTIIGKNFIKFPPRWLNIIISLLISWFSIYLVQRLSFSRAVAFLAIFALLLFLISIGLFLKNYTYNFVEGIVIIITALLLNGIARGLIFIFWMLRFRMVAKRDTVTSLYMRDYFDLSLSYEFNKSAADKRNFSLVLMGIDHFKKLKNIHGRQFSESVLITLSSMIRKLSRQSDILCLYSEEEFGVILKGTNQAGAAVYAEKIRRSVCDNVFNDTKEIPVKITVSLGACGLWESKSKSSEELSKYAQSFLDRARNEGGNKVLVSQL